MSSIHFITYEFHHLQLAQCVGTMLGNSENNDLTRETNVGIPLDQIISSIDFNTRPFEKQTIVDESNIQLLAEAIKILRENERHGTLLKKPPEKGIQP